jgi:hypothetical protein
MWQYRYRIYGKENEAWAELKNKAWDEIGLELTWEEVEASAKD